MSLNKPLSTFLPWLGLTLVAVLSLTPLLAEPLPVTWVPAYQSPIGTWVIKAVVVGLMLLAVAIRTWADQDEEPSAVPLAVGFLAVAALMTAWHWFWRDSDPSIAAWQREMYLDILNHQREAPHQFRALPYGLTRTLEWLTGDWVFSCLAYRWFFTYWFVWGAYRFARLWHSPERALLTVVPLVVLYPLSVWYYWGQLTDPLSHALFVLALLYVVQDRWLLLAACLALGVLAKETVVLVVPAYFSCYWRGGLRTILRTSLLGAACVTAFLAARVPFGWGLGYQNINGTERLMIWDNLGLGEPFYSSAAPLYQHYLHPALFVGAFLPALAWGWGHLDGRLKALGLTLVPLLLVSNLCFSWMYESRNYMPLVPLLATAALAALVPRKECDRANPTISIAYLRCDE